MSLAQRCVRMRAAVAVERVGRAVPERIFARGVYLNA